MKRAIGTCLVVGTLLVVINHGDQLMKGQMGSTMAWQIGLTYLVPFVVATVSAAAATRSRPTTSRPEQVDAAPDLARVGPVRREPPA